MGSSGRARCYDRSLQRLASMRGIMSDLSLRMRLPEQALAHADEALRSYLLAYASAGANAASAPCRRHRAPPRAQLLHKLHRARSMALRQWLRVAPSGARWAAQWTASCGLSMRPTTPGRRHRRRWVSAWKQVRRHLWGHTCADEQCRSHDARLPRACDLQPLLLLPPVSRPVRSSAPFRQAVDLAGRMVEPAQIEAHARMDAARGVASPRGSAHRPAVRLEPAPRRMVGWAALYRHRPTFTSTSATKQRHEIRTIVRCGRYMPLATKITPAMRMRMAEPQRRQLPPTWLSHDGIGCAGNGGRRCASRSRAAAAGDNAWYRSAVILRYPPRRGFQHSLAAAVTGDARAKADVAETQGRRYYATPLQGVAAPALSGHATSPASSAPTVRNI